MWPPANASKLTPHLVIQHGAPLHRLDMGTTEISEEIFEEYLTDLKELYTADRYHLLRYNCNNFTADVRPRNTAILALCTDISYRSSAF